ncbi:MAG: ribosomal protein [Deltaproteobacteria bacterium]|nr:ribosomal protein [Deltaproteobacteria bacterium]
MPKMKTHRGAAKRFTRTGTGKIMRSHESKRHILTKKSAKQKRRLSGRVEVSHGDRMRLEQMLP